jgi:hypothetical protein
MNRCPKCHQKLKNCTCKNNYKYYYIVGIILIIIYVFVFTMKIREENGKNFQYQDVQKVQSYSYSEEEINDFGENKLTPILQRFMNHEFEILEINHRLRDNIIVMQNRYGKGNIGISLIDVYGESKRIEAGAYVDEKNQPFIEFIIPAQMDLYFSLQKQYSDYKEKYEITVITSFLHEMDHLAYGEDNSTPTSQQLIAEETEIWWLTCQYTIQPLVNSGIELFGDLSVFYGKFLEAQDDIQIWNDFISEQYSL